jgi:hypothetical protein
VKRSPSQIVIKLTAIACFLLSLSGCTVGSKYHPPVPPAPDAANYKESPVNFQDATAGRWPAQGMQCFAVNGGRCSMIRP